MVDGVQMAAFCSKVAHFEWSLVGGKIHSLKQLKVRPPLQWIPNHILAVHERYQKGEISQTVNRRKWWDARRKLRVYNLIDEPPAKRQRRVTNADSCRRWRQKIGAGLVASRSSSASSSDDDNDAPSAAPPAPAPSAPTDSSLPPKPLLHTDTLPAADQNHPVK